MAVGAFKTKYTGEQIETLLDKINSDTDRESQAGEGQYYSIEAPNATLSGNTQSYKHGIMKIDFSGSLYSYRNILNLLAANSTMSIPVVKGTMVYTFDVPITVKRIRFSDYQKKGGTLYYYKDNTWISAGSIAQGATSLNIENITQLKVVMDYNKQGYSDVYYCIFDFITDEYVTGMSIKNGTL